MRAERVLAYEKGNQYARYLEHRSLSLIRSVVDEKYTNGVLPMLQNLAGGLPLIYVFSDSSEL